MTYVHAVGWENPDTIRVILENTTNRDCADTAIAKGATAGALDVDTDDLAVLTITDCDADGGRHPRDLGADTTTPPTSRIIRLEWNRTPQ